MKNEVYTDLEPNIRGAKSVRILALCDELKRLDREETDLQVRRYNILDQLAPLLSYKDAKKSFTLRDKDMAYLFGLLEVVLEESKKHDTKRKT